MEGYPPLPDDLRTTVRDGEWTFPADLPLSELERRLEERLRNDHDLAEVAVSIDDRGRATVDAAPPLGALSRRVPQGKRAVSVDALVPTGLARRDEVTVSTPDDEVEGTVLSARSGEGEASIPTAPSATSPPAGSDATDEGTGGDPESVRPTPAPSGTAGGDGRVTLAVSRSEAETLVRAPSAAVRVRARETRREFELFSLLRRDGKRLQRIELTEDSPLAGATLGSAGTRETYGVAVLAVRRDRTWTVAPPGTTRLAAGDELYVVGSRDDLDRFAEVSR